MVRIDLFIFGYRKITFPEERAGDIANLLLRCGISAKIKNNSEIYLKSRDSSKIADKLSAIGATIGEIRGLPYHLFRILGARGVLAALVPVLLILAFSSDLVWDVRVTGEGVARETVMEELRSAGFGIGSRWSAADRGKIENRVLLSSDTISWININRRGGVAYVSATPKISREDNDGELGYSNIVAEYDCVIDEITVISGYAEVSVGDAVSAGDLLISGVIPEESGGGFCRAQGIVRGRITTELSVSVDRNETLKAPGERSLFELSVQIFNFSANIFKKYGNVDNSCDIIKDVEDLVVFGRYRLPVSLTKKYATPYYEICAEYTDAELVSVASSRLMSLVKTEMYSSDVVAIRSFGAFSDTGYTAFAVLTAIIDVGREQAFDAE